MQLLQLRKTVIDSGLKLLANNLVQGTWGNSSCRIDQNTMLISPSGLNYNDLTPEDMVIVDINTLEYKGKHKPSSEQGIHAGIYRSRADINAVIHTHPTYCSVMSATRQPLPCLDKTMQNLIGGDVKVSSYGLPGTNKLTRMAIKGIHGRNACFMANHGVVCAGKDMEQAFEVIMFLEDACKNFIQQKALEKTNQTVFSEQLINDYYLSKQ